MFATSLWWRPRRLHHRPARWKWGALRLAVLVALLTLGGPPALVAAEAPVATVSDRAVAVLADDRFVLDRVEVHVPVLPAPPIGTQYRVWLQSEDQRFTQFVGDVGPPATTLTWSQPAGENLLLQFSVVLVTVESSAAPGTQPGETVLLRGQIDPGVLPPARRLFVRWADSRYGTASLVGARRLADLARVQVEALLQEAAGGNLAGMQRKAEHLINLVEGQQGGFFGDHNQDGRTEDPGDGVGLLSYLWGAMAQARTAWAQATSDETAASALAIEAPLLYSLDWAGFVRDAALELARTNDVARARDLAGHLARAAGRVAAGIDARDDLALLQLLDERDFRPAYDRARELIQAPLTPPCRFILGFAAIAALIPDRVGLCLENERIVPGGNAEQRTTGGRLMWRRADNWTAFTDGLQTWINGPDGLVQRLNTERFPWETQE